jgi:glycerol-3-phosphate dehydrogenase
MTGRRETPVDVAVIGAGVVGCAVARELAGRRLAGQPVQVALIDARDDVGDGTSKANTAILHTGFDATPGTLEARLVARGYHLLSEYARATGIAIEPLGAVLVAWTDEEQAALPGLEAKAVAGGFPDCRPLTAEQVYGLLPNLGAGVLGGLEVPGESIIDPWTTPLAFATDALARGARLLLGHRVLDVTVPAVDKAGGGRDGRVTVLHTDRGVVRARWVVNAAGLGGDQVDALFGHHRFTVTPRRGELLVFDKLARPLVDRIVLPVPTALGKGVLISPTVFGNVMLGPTAQDLTDRADTATSEQGLALLAERGRRLMPRLLQEEVTAGYAGLRAATEHDDYVVQVDADQRYAVLGGIRSTGLTASMALAEHLAELLRQAGLPLRPRTDLPPPPRMPNLGEAFERPYSSAEKIAADPEYGRVVCFCERVTRGEIRDALRSAIPPCDLDGVRRRTRAMMGRCQGFYCGALVDTLLSAELAATGRAPRPGATDVPVTAASAEESR